MSQTIVIKIGTSSLTIPETGSLALSTIATLVETLTNLRQKGYNIILVSSGAVGVGCGRLGISKRPQNLNQKQAIAAVGQGRLIRIYDDLFNNLGQPIAQILLTRHDFKERSSYVNASNTFRALLDLGVIPVVNENDTVATDELKFGDNDTLSALVASLVDADWLFLLTDVDKLYSADPRLVPSATPIDLVARHELSNLDIDVGDSGTNWGTGGMVTKITAARIATGAGVTTVITNGKNPTNILDILAGRAIGTRFEPQPRPENARKRWIINGLVSKGKIYLDNGATKAICEQGKSLLSAGILAIEGDFNSADAVDLYAPDNLPVARGIVNYSSNELQLIKGKKSQKIYEILGYEGAQTVIHRDNLVVID
ncbi:glutamate 5-kinase [Cyanobacterium stanieri LEGE 03274]|uniref:Glutamate 5-kinase n=1 Tax=Cyanobacterium stanieri LEGE 03274 TaxID=1828756 RepID=A0ABR9V5G3_9CHRO|nr:glutamate 5-kinase [Cyanobacterium stanieri]MBE9223140.1 glutamate 5-kinase [Cyanobacterium stanieri LEGE 03274]